MSTQRKDIFTYVLHQYVTNNMHKGETGNER